MRLLVTSVIGLAVGMAFGSLAHGHGAANWIRQNSNTEFCCFQQHCTPLPPAPLHISRPAAIC